MQINVQRSIQEYLKKINSSLTTFDCVSISVTSILLALFASYLYVTQKRSSLPVSYNVASTTEVALVDQRPFASINGKTYTFAWCQGADAISLKNKIYFTNEEDARRTGRTLSKLCN